MPDPSAAELVDLIIRRAPALREAGVLEIEIGEFKAILSPHQEPYVVAVKTEDKEEIPGDPLLDPHTYGLPRGAKLPGLSHLEVVDAKAGGKR